MLREDGTTFDVANPVIRLQSKTCILRDSVLAGLTIRGFPNTIIDYKCFGYLIDTSFKVLKYMALIENGRRLIRF